MLNSIPKIKCYFFYDALDDWFNNIAELKKYSNIVFKANKQSQISITIHDGYINIKLF